MNFGRSSRSSQENSLAPYLGGRPASLALKQRIWSRLGYDPSTEQLLFHEGLGHDGRLARNIIDSGGEQSGKSLSAAMEGVPEALVSNIIWCVAPNYDQARPEMEYMRDALLELGAIRELSFPNTPNPLRIVTDNGCLIRSISSQDVTKIANESPDLILMVEAAQQPIEAFWRCVGRTGPNRGRLLINGTLEGSTGWFAETFKRWSAANEDEGVAYKLPSWSNRAKYPGGRDDPEILRQERILPHDQFMERFAGEPVPPANLVHPLFRHTTHVYAIGLEGIHDVSAYPEHRRLVLPADVPLQLWIDPGYAGGYAVLAVALYQDRVFVVDEIYTQYHTTDEVIDVALTKPWYGRVAKLVGDIAGEQHQAMKAPAEIWRKRTGLSYVGKKIGIVDGIARVDQFLKPNPLLGVPQLVVAHRCPKTIWEFTEGYKRECDALGTVKEKPRDQHNHAAKAVVYGINWNFPLVYQAPKSVVREPIPWQRRGRATRRVMHYR